MSKWTSISIKSETKKKLVEVKGVMEFIDGKAYTYDDVISKLADSVMIEFKKKVKDVGDQLQI